MTNQKQIRDLAQAGDLSPTDTVQVSAEDLKGWALEMRALREALLTEREECISIAEHYLGQLYHGHGTGGEMAITAIIREIRGRAHS